MGVKPGLYHFCSHTIITYSILILRWCVLFRYVLDGFPLSVEQVELMTERCLIPVRVFELMVIVHIVLVCSFQICIGWVPSLYEAGGTDDRKVLDTSQSV